MQVSSPSINQSYQGQNYVSQQQYGGPVGSNLPLDASFGQASRTAYFSNQPNFVADQHRTTSIVNHNVVPTINHQSSRVQSPAFASNIKDQIRTQPIQNVGLQRTTHSVPNVSNYQSQVNRVQTVQPQPVSQVQHQNLVSHVPIRVEQLNVPQTKVHITQPQIQIPKPVDQQINSQINKTIVPSNKVNIGFNTQGQIKNIQSQPQNQVQVQPHQAILPQPLTQEIPRPITRPLAI